MKDEKAKISHEEISRLGGLGRAKKLGAERRRDIARLGGQISARNKKAKKKNGKSKSKDK